MSLFSAILVPLDGSPVALRSLGCAMWLAARLGAQVHSLNVGEPLPEAEALEKLGVPGKYRALLELHQIEAEAGEAILAAIERYKIDLVVMTARGESASEVPPDVLRIVGHVTREVIEHTAVPVLLLPPAYEESLPWRAALAPISGEAATDQALTLALRLAHALELAVTIVHVADSAQVSGGGRIRAGPYDEAHHEYPQLLDEFVARACPMCSAEERRRITGFHLCRGDVAQELLRLIEAERVNLLIVGWHGEFMTGHAEVLKRLLWQARCAVLLVKPQPRAVFRLKVGDALV
ncbi:MAG TPA: universal stress protein [Alphaproteobacteria bacterium]|nr:universal stress protein [Alphaproteobacteria bacterium]